MITKSISEQKGGANPTSLQAVPTIISICPIHRIRRGVLTPSVTHQHGFDKKTVGLKSMVTPKRICLCLSSWSCSTKSTTMDSTLKIINECRCNHPLFASRLDKFLHSIWMGRPLNISFVWKRKESSRKSPKRLMEMQFLSHISNTSSPHQCHKQYLQYLHFYFTYNLRNISWMQGWS